MNVRDRLRSAYHFAKWSPDPSNQNGAIIVNDISMSEGWNDFPIGTEVTDELLQNREAKLRRILHAERSAIYSAASRGLCTDGATMYCPWAACCDCARGIIHSGISHLWVHGPRMDTTPDRWKADVDYALSMLQDAEVAVSYYDDPIDQCPDILVNGKLWNPGG